MLNTRANKIHVLIEQLLLLNSIVLGAGAISLHLQSTG